MKTEFDLDRLCYLKRVMPKNVTALMLYPENIHNTIALADPVDGKITRKSVYYGINMKYMTLEDVVN